VAAAAAQRMNPPMTQPTPLTTLAARLHRIQSIHAIDNSPCLILQRCHCAAAGNAGPTGVRI
jgi:hypothetical protein